MIYDIQSLRLSLLISYLLKFISSKFIFLNSSKVLFSSSSIKNTLFEAPVIAMLAFLSADAKNSNYGILRCLTW